jgi:GT2 family glycosyltransferase
VAAAEQRGVSGSRPVLAVIPSFVRTPEDMEILLACLVTLQQTAPNVRTLVVDDCSPATELIDQLEAIIGQVGAELVRKPENTGFSRTVNVGLREALATGADAVLINADIEFDTPGWLEAMQERTDTNGNPAAVVGALLIYPIGVIQHAGVFFSQLTRMFGHRHRFGPPNLPEALTPTRCPVTAALQYIRWETLDTVGLYDEEFQMSYEDVDYCLRVFDAGLECIYEPRARAIHHESVFRARKVADDWQNASLLRLRAKYQKTDLGQWVPSAG